MGETPRPWRATATTFSMALYLANLFDEGLFFPPHERRHVGNLPTSENSNSTIFPVGIPPSA